MKLPRKLTMNAIVDYIAFTGFVFLTTTGVLMRYLLPPGSGHRTTIWSLDRHDWGAIHFWIAVTVFGVLSLHIVLHWKWIVSVIKGKPRRGSRARFLLGLGSLIVVIALGLTPLVSPVQVRDRTGRESGDRIEIPDRDDSDEAAEDYHSAARKEIPPSSAKGTTSGDDREFDFDDVPIYGAMSLEKIADETGVPASYILEQLGIIDNISPDSRLGRLSREYGFAMSDVRRIVLTYAESKKRP